ncbi:MAG: glycyl-radical enzyme activating protein [Acidobacteriota bacterium]
MKGIIFDIKKYAIHDGPGIRTTVFLKGCPLQCWWCHNPEGQSPKKELFFNPEKCLDDCTDCIAACPNQAITKDNTGITINKNKCKMMGECAEACPTSALKIVGRQISLDELMKEIEKDQIFYQNSNGGITFSGGEPLAQIEFLDALLQRCSTQHIHTVVDTCGYAPFENFEKIMDKVDLFLYDLKMMDEEKHIETTGASNQLILENLKNLGKSGKKIHIRIPLIPEVNDTNENARETSLFLRTISGINNISLLPYHKAGNQKYLNLKRNTKNIQPIPETKIKRLQEIYEKFGFSIKMGG